MSNKSNIVTCVCVFCCKKIPVHKATSISHSQFFEVLERFLKIDSLMKESISSTENSNVQVEICEDCSLVTKTFCDLYHQLKCVELQIQWKIETLKNVMKVANRVPSRIKGLKEVFWDTGQDNEENGLLNYQKIMKIRNQIIMLCTQKLAKVLPRVTLLKLNGSPVLEKVVVNPETEPSETSKTDFTSQFVSWVVSFIAVAMLCLTPTLDPINTSDEAAIIDIDDLDNNVDLQVPSSLVIEETPIQMDNDSDDGNLDDLNQFEIFEAIEPERVLTQEENGVILTPVSVQTEDHIGSESSSSYTCSDDEEESNVVIEDNSNSQVSQDQTLDNETEVEQIEDVEQKPGLEIQRNVKIEYSNEKLRPENKVDKRNRTKRGNFVCQYCPKSFSSQHGLRLHITQMHPINSGPYFCKSCNRSLPNYQQYLGHRKSIMHLRRLKIQNEIKGTNAIKDNVIITESPSKNPLSILKTSRTNVGKRTLSISRDTDSSSSSSSSFKEATTVAKNKKYNLRSKRFTSMQKETSDSDTDSDCSSMSNSEDSSSASSNEETKPERKPRTRKLNLNRQRWYCFKEGCTYRTENELAYKQHKKLHEPGEYKCMFCDVVEVNALKLALHEERKHCNRERTPGHFYCSRCPYLSQFKLTYIRHFTQFHLDFPDLCVEMCPICKIATKNSSLHFKAAHDISKVKPEDIVRCQINECTAYFINTLGLQKHRQEVHLRQLIRENSNSQDNYKGEFKCKICNICFATKRERTKHRRVFHEQEQLSLLKETDLPLSRTKIPCPVLDCHKRFRDNESLKEHQKLHGSFSCQFCSVVIEYAPDLATHELEHNSESSESSLFKCPRCSFKSIRQLTYVSHHLEEHLGVTDKIIPCKICGKRFRDHLLLLAHFKHFHDSTSKTMKIKTCSKCPCYYRTQLQLWRHQLSCHEYIFCQESGCNKKFKKFRELEEHLKLHGSFKCQFCEIAVKYAPDLPIHELEHANDASSSQSQSICCPRCSTVFKDKRVMITHHLAVHLKLSDKGFVCNVCCERLRSSEQKSHHIGKYHGTKLASNARQCNQCPAYFLMDTQLTKHQEMAHGFKCSEDKFMCDVETCNLGFRTELELNDHKTWHGNFKCQFCSVCVKYAPDLMNHELEHHASTGKKTGHFKCPRCNSEKFKFKPKLVHHFLEEHLNITSKVYRCPFCQLPGAFKGHINRHILMAHKTQGTDNQEIFSCLECPATFLKEMQLDHHKQTVHGEVCAPVFECKLCEKSFKCKKSLQGHMKRVHDIESTFKFVCTQQNCNRRFQTKYDLELHLLHSSYYHDIKSGKKELVMHKCDKCGRECKGIRALKGHMRVHREGRPTEFKCEQCPKVFKSKAALESHSIYHKGPNEWKFMCAICSKKCASKQKLEEHTRTHTKEKHFVCQICGEKYAHRHNLRNHVKSKHNGEGLEVGPTKARMRFYVSRKGKKLEKGFCFTQQ